MAKKDKFTCLVTGGFGFIGSHVVEELIRCGHYVVVVDNGSTGTIDNLKHIKSGNLSIIESDLVFASEVDRIFGRVQPDYVFHLASLARIQVSIEKPFLTHDTNVNGSFNVINACVAHKVKKLIFSSTSALYYGQPVPSSEMTKIGFSSPYCLHKLITEQYIGLYTHLYGLKATILRYFNVFGERQILEGEYAAVVGIFMDQYRNNKKTLTLTGDGEQRRDFTYVKDVATANRMALNEAWDSRIVNIGSGKNYSINQLADAFPKAKKTYLPARAGEGKETLCDNTLARSLGWQPTVDITDWVKQQKL